MVKGVCHKWQQALQVQAPTTPGIRAYEILLHCSRLYPRQATQPRPAFDTYVIAIEARQTPIMLYINHASQRSTTKHLVHVSNTVSNTVSNVAHHSTRRAAHFRLPTQHDAHWCRHPAVASHRQYARQQQATLHSNYIPAVNRASNVHQRAYKHMRQHCDQITMLCRAPQQASHTM